jgi:hypothetical protein
MKRFRFFTKFLLLIFFNFLCVFSVFAQDILLKIKLLEKNRVGIEGNFKAEASSMINWSFLQEYADVSNLAERIENLQLFDNKGEKIETKRLNAGEYLVSQKPVSFKYQVNLTPSTKITDAAHVSWLTADYGILMLADLLPQFQTANILVETDFGLPEKKIVADNRLSKVENTVFFIGKNWREREVKLADKNHIFKLAINGTWQFSDEEAVEMTKSIMEEYGKLFGDLPMPNSQIILSPFPQENSNSERWRAETRGQNVTIISGAIPYKSQALQRLHEQLRHEIFHLWLPNGLNLSGNYDWFYEGFTIYHALRTGVELNQIRFEDFLNTLGKAYDLSEGLNSTLLEASKKRWAGTGNFIYAKGLVVAFLCDAALLKASKGRRNLKDVFRQVWNKHRFPNQIQDGNAAILSILETFPELNSIIRNYLQGGSKIIWDNDLADFGILAEKSDFGIQLKVLPKLNGRQKDLLDKLGYNQWRKILPKTR